MLNIRKKRNKRGLALLFSLSLLIAPIQSFAITSSSPTENVIVTFNSKVDPNVINFINNNKGKIDWKPQKIESISAVVPADKIDAIKKYSTVKGVEIDSTIKIKEQTPNWGIQQTATPSAWNLNYTGKGVKVAILDTGISNHPDLLISGGISYVSYTSSYNDDNGHGTHVAGIIGAKDNDFGVVGVAKDANVYAVKVMGSDGSGMVSDIISGIDWSIANHMDIINMSLGTQSDSLALHDAVNRAINSGIIVVAAAGNDGNSTGTGDTVDYPGRYDNVLTVAATDSNNNKASFSSAGPSVDLAAPGVYVNSTLNNGGYGEMSGTSMATPFVAGIMALYKEAYPNYTATQLENLAESNAIDLGSPGKDSLFGYGLIQAPKEQGTASVPSVPNSPTNFTANEVLTKSISLSWDAINTPSIYELQRNGVVIYTGSQTNFNDVNLMPGVNYTYQLVAKNTGGNSVPESINVKTKTATLATPTGFTITPSSTNIKLSWHTVTGATSYLVKRNGVVVYNNSTASFSDTGLQPASSYSYEIIAKNDSGVSYSAVIKAGTTPSAPTNLIESHTTNSANLTWNTVSGATYYSIKNNKTGSIIYKGISNTIQLNQLLSGVEYSFSVYAGNISGTSEAASVTFTTIPTAPTTPVLLSSSADQTSVSLNWKPIYNAQMYRVKRNDEMVYQGTLNSFKDVGLTPGTDYTYSISATNDIGTSGSSIVKKTTIPNTPDGLNGTPTTNSVALSWNAVTGATYYEVKNNGVIIYKGLNTSFNHSGLLSNIQNQYTVFAGNTSGISPSSQIVVVKTLQSAPATTVLTGSIMTQNSIAFSWRAIYNASSYVVTKDGVIVYDGALLTYKDTGLSPGEQHTYTITTKNEVGSNAPLVITKKTIPNTPTGLTGESTSNSSTLHWDAVPGATYYLLKKNGNIVYKGDVTTYAVTGLLSNVENQYTITAGNESGLSPVSAIVKVKTLQSIPSTPYMTKIVMTNTTANVYWYPVYNATTYTLKRNGIVVYTGSSLSFLDNMLQPGQIYTYSLTANNEIGMSSERVITVKLPY